MSEPKPQVPWTEATDKSATYIGHCHCGAVQYKATISPPLYASATPADGQYEVVNCDCSICERNGYLLVYPFQKDIEWIGDSQEHMKKYYMANKVCPHFFCENCGSSIGPDLTVVAQHMGGDPRFALNVSMQMA